ncbi:unnamed protein product [Lota lota]
MCRVARKNTSNKTLCVKSHSDSERFPRGVHSVAALASPALIPLKKPPGNQGVGLPTNLHPFLQTGGFQGPPMWSDAQRRVRPSQSCCSRYRPWLDISGLWWKIYQNQYQ